MSRLTKSSTLHIARALMTATLIPIAIGGPAMADQKPAQKPVLTYSNVMQAEAKSKTACEAAGGRIFVDTKWGSECIAYFVTAGFEQLRRAVVFFDGDMALEKYADPAKMAAALDANKIMLQRWSDKLKVRYLFVSRVGLNGSSGNHGERRKPRELMILNAATDILKAKLGLDTIALAGQSGGSTIAASMLSLGRNDVTCAVLGSGAYELVELHHKNLAALGKNVSTDKLQDTMFDPASHVDSIVPNAQHRILILGDKSDTRTPFDQQQRYAASLASFGHHVKLIPIDASGELSHGTTVYTIPTAGGCLNGVSDERLVEANNKVSKQRAAAEIANAAPPASGAAALMRTSLSSGEK